MISRTGICTLTADDSRGNLNRRETFEVLPNRATYIGTLRHRVRIDDPHPVFSTNINFGLQMENELASATKRILAPYDKLQYRAEMRLAEVQVLDTAVFKRTGPADKQGT